MSDSKRKPTAEELNFLVMGIRGLQRTAESIMWMLDNLDIEHTAVMRIGTAERNLGWAAFNLTSQATRMPND